MTKIPVKRQNVIKVGKNKVYKGAGAKGHF